MTDDQTRRVSREEMRRVQSAAGFVHALTCPAPGKDHDWRQCLAGRWLVNWSTLYALEHLDAHPRDAAGARLILHDAVCMSGCAGAGRVEHSRRHAATVAALRKFRAQEFDN
jgi:hypothetical protein